MSAQSTGGAFEIFHEKVWAAYFLKVIDPLSSEFGTLRKTPRDLISNAYKVWGLQMRNRGEDGP
jgi:hypothetical protein